MDFHPAAAESDYPVHQFLIDFRLTFSYAGFQYPLQQSVIFYKRFQESVFSRHLPAGRYRYSGSLLILLINLTHGCHTIQIDHRDWICPLCHCHRSLHHSLCPRILPVQISHMSQYADSEQPLPDRKIRKVTIQWWCSLFRRDMDQNTGHVICEQAGGYDFRIFFFFHIFSQDLCHIFPCHLRFPPIPEGKVRKSRKHICGETQYGIFTGLVFFHTLNAGFCLCPEKIQFSPCNFLKFRIFKLFHRLFCFSRQKCASHQWQYRAFLSFFGNSHPGSIRKHEALVKFHAQYLRCLLPFLRGQRIPL